MFRGGAGHVTDHEDSVDDIVLVPLSIEFLDGHTCSDLCLHGEPLIADVTRSWLTDIHVSN